VRRGRLPVTEVFLRTLAPRALVGACATPGLPSALAPWPVGRGAAPGGV